MQISSLYFPKSWRRSQHNAKTKRFGHGRYPTASADEIPSDKLHRIFPWCQSNSSQMHPLMPVTQEEQSGPASSIVILPFKALLNGFSKQRGSFGRSIYYTWYSCSFNVENSGEFQANPSGNKESPNEHRLSVCTLVTRCVSTEPGRHKSRTE